jgi:peptide/nickel transport system substrate-binding protein
VLETAPDPDAARGLLQDAGWGTGQDRVRERDGQRAEFTLMYPAGDTIRQNLALDVQAQAAGLGIEVRPEGLSWEAIEPRMAIDALVYGTGNPYHPDLTSYPLLHSSRAHQGFDNPGGYASAQMDLALDQGRAAADEGERVAAYARVQAQLAEDLPWIFLVYLEHGYVIRAGTWAGYDVPLVEPHEHGLQGGPWWNLPEWTAAAP